MDKERVLVTGATGFVGQHCILQLLQKGYEVRGSVRKYTKSQRVRDIVVQHLGTDEGLDFIQADLNNFESWIDATKDVDYVLHVASPFPLKMPKDPNALIQTAKQGTVNVLKASMHNKVKKVIQTSSVAAIAYGKEELDKVFTEDDWTNVSSKDDTTPYILSKTYAEKAAWGVMHQTGTTMELTAINPALVLGPALEKDLSTSMEIIRKMMKGHFPGYPSIGFSIVDVRDVAKLHIKAMETPGLSGERFICADKFMWFGEISSVLQQHFPNYKRKLPKRQVPNWALKFFAKFDGSAESILSDLDKKREVSNQKAKTMLNWKPIDSEASIIAAAESLIQLGVV